MIDPWFDPNRWAWLPGTLFGVLGGCWGSLAGILAPMGRARRLVLGGGVAMFAVAVIFLASGAVALALRQPYGIWYGLMLPGLLGVFVLPFQFPMIRRRYREAELRRMQAEDLS